MTFFRSMAFCALTLTVTVGCSEDDGGSTTGGGGINWSGAGGSDTGGSGGDMGVGGMGVGGMGVGANGGAGGGVGGAAGGGGGSVETGTVLAVALGSSGGVTASRVAGGPWSSAALGDASTVRPAIAAFTGGDATAMYLSGSTVRAISWSGGAFGSPADYASGAQGAPAYEATGADGHLAYHGSNFQYFYDQGESVKPPMGSPSFGPTAPAIAALSNGPVIAHAGDDGSLYTQARTGGQWQAAVNVAGSLVEKSPAMVALASGPDLLVVWVNDDPGSTDDTKVAFATYSGGMWSTPAFVGSDVFTQEDVTLTALAGGDALIGLRGTDGKGYTVRFSGGSWGAPVGLAAPTSLDVAAAPGVAAGVDGQDAEACYVGSDGVAYHVRLTGGAWSSPETIGGTGLAHCAVVAIP